MDHVVGRENDPHGLVDRHGEFPQRVTAVGILEVPQPLLRVNADLECVHGRDAEVDEPLEALVEQVTASKKTGVTVHVTSRTCCDPSAPGSRPCAGAGTSRRSTAWRSTMPTKNTTLIQKMK